MAQTRESIEYFLKLARAQGVPLLPEDVASLAPVPDSDNGYFDILPLATPAKIKEFKAALHSHIPGPWKDGLIAEIWTALRNVAAKPYYRCPEPLEHGFPQRNDWAAIRGACGLLLLETTPKSESDLDEYVRAIQLILKLANRNLARWNYDRRVCEMRSVPSGCQLVGGYPASLS